MWNIPPLCHPGLLQALALNTLSHSLAHREVFFIFFFLLTWLAHSGSAENSQLHLRAFSHDSSSAASEDQQSAQRAPRSAICPGKAASRGKQWVLSLLWCRGTFQPLKYPTAFYYYYCPLSRMIHQTICESCACFPAGLSTFAIYFGQTGFQHFFFAFWEIALAFFHFVFFQTDFQEALASIVISAAPSVQSFCISKVKVTAKDSCGTTLKAFSTKRVASLWKQ